MQGKNILTCETSKGTPFLIKAYDNYFEILSGDGSSKLYTSESLNVDFGGRYFINEVKDYGLLSMIATGTAVLNTVFGL